MDLLTVVYRDELDLLKKQARSISYYFYHEIQNIYVILNDDTLTHDDIDVSWYGDIGYKVRIFHRSEFGYYPSPQLGGWYTQQVCKILGTAHAESKWCMILDAKTWFIRPFKIEEIFDQYNRARFAIWDIPHTHWNRGIEYLKTHYNIPRIDWLSPAGVPFLADVQTMKEMVYEEPDFINWFESNCEFNINGITEFLCYSAWVTKQGNFDDLYTGEQIIDVANLADYDVPNFNIWWRKVHQPNTLTASVHPRAYKILDYDQSKAWHQFVKDRIV